MLETLNIGDRVRLIFDHMADAPQEATVCSVLSNEQEGLGPEVSDYVACWLEVSLAEGNEQSGRVSISLGTDYRYDLGGRKLRIEKLDG